MIKQIKIKNFKSIPDLTLDLGQITVFIGQNGSGKSNILEAITLLSASVNNSLKNEFLVSRGIRVTEPQFMVSAFQVNREPSIILESVIEGIEEDNQKIAFELTHEKGEYNYWEIKNKDFSFFQLQANLDQMMEDYLNKYYSSTEEVSKPEFHQVVKDYLSKIEQEYEKIEKKYLSTLKEFLIYSPEISKLRIFEEEGQIQPLGIYGEGLFKFLKYLYHKPNQSIINLIKEKLELIDWFENFVIPQNLLESEKVIRIKDRFLESNTSLLTQQSSNEGFLLFLFYLCLFTTEETPSFLAIDNIDSSLNPRLCRRMMVELIELAKTNNKQVIFTTHNPAILDGLDLDDEKQRLYVVDRNRLGYTKLIRIHSPKVAEGEEPVRLSEAFLRGYLGGLPKNF